MTQTENAPHKKGPVNRLSIAAFVLALLQIFGPIAAILGHVSLGQIKRRSEKGRAFALIAVIVGWIQTSLFAVFLVSPRTLGFAFGYLFGLFEPQ